MRTKASSHPLLRVYGLAVMVKISVSLGCPLFLWGMRKASHFVDELQRFVALYLYLCRSNKYL